MLDEADHLKMCEEEHYPIPSKPGCALFGVKMRIAGADDRELPWNGVESGDREWDVSTSGAKAETRHSSMNKPRPNFEHAARITL